MVDLHGRAARAARRGLLPAAARWPSSPASSWPRRWPSCSRRSTSTCATPSTSSRWSSPPGSGPARSSTPYQSRSASKLGPQGPDLGLLPQPDDAARPVLPALHLRAHHHLRHRSTASSTTFDVLPTKGMALVRRRSTSACCSSSRRASSSSPSPSSAGSRATSPRSSERERLRGRRPGRLQAVPPGPRAVQLAQGAHHPRRQAPGHRGLLGPERRLARRSRRARRSASSAATARASRPCSSASAACSSRPSGEVAVRGKLAGLLELGAGFQQDLTGRENIYLNGSLLGHVQARGRPGLRRHRRLLRARGVHRRPGQVLLLGHVRAARLRRGREHGPRRPGDRRGAGRRRRALPAQVHRPGQAVPAGGPHHPAGDALGRHRAQHLRPRRGAQPRPAGRRGRARRSDAHLPGGPHGGGRGHVDRRPDARRGAGDADDPRDRRAARRRAPGPVPLRAPRLLG